MTYTINRLIESKNTSGEDELFVDLIIEDEVGLYSSGYWLTKKELDDYKNDNSLLDLIIKNFIPIAKKNYQDSLLMVDL